MLIQDLECQFPHLDIMEAMGVVFPEYWLNAKCDELIPIHMQVIWKWFCKIWNMVVPINEQPIALNELLPSQLKGRNSGGPRRRAKM
jgi:hypothetical protein